MGVTVSAQDLSVGEVAGPGPIPFKVIFAVCDELNVSPIDLVSTDRHAPLPMGRKLVAWCLKSRGFSEVQIGEVIGRSEATVRYYLRNLDRRRRNEWATIDLCSKIRLRLES